MRDDRNGRTLADRLQQLPRADKALIAVIIGFGLTALFLGIVFGLLVAVDEAGWIELPPMNVFQVLTLHATNVFYYWLYFVQIGIMLALLLASTEGARLARPARALLWAAVLLLYTGWTLNLFAPASGAAVTYAAPLELATEFEGSAFFYAGYVLLGSGLFFAGLAGVLAALESKRSGAQVEWPALGYAVLCWFVLLVVAAIIALLANLPAFQVALGYEPWFRPFNYTMAWSVYFHNMHYLPLLSTVIVWYAIVEATTGIKSVFGDRFSKLVFTLYLVLVPPTSLYHLFLEPEVAANVKLVGSLLALFISVPTLAVFLIIVVSLQMAARARGAAGLFGWLRVLPWRNPAFAAVAMATLSALAGGAFANVVIQERFAQVVSDTFMVPGYFHFLTVGTVTVTYLGALVYIVPAMTGRPLSLPSLATLLPYIATLGVYIFGLSGVAAGYLGAPRRTIAFDYEGLAPSAWSGLMQGVAIGGSIMGGALLGYILIIALVATGAELRPRALDQLPIARLQPAGAPTFGAASFAVFAVLLFLAALYAATLAAWRVMQSLPLAS